MSLLAGIFGKAADVAIEESQCEAIKHAISRHPEDRAVVFRDSRVCLVKVDMGLYGEPAFRIGPTGTVAMLAGEPLLRRDGDDAHGRADDLELLRRAWDQADWDVLKEARGTFCAVHYRPDTATLSLIADKVGLRPLYYWVGDRFVVFSSALRVLEALPYVPKVMDLEGVTEICSFNNPLGTRTPYSDIAALREGEIIQFSGGGVSARQYWRWDGIPPSDSPEPELLKEVHARFSAAVRRRLRREKVAVAFLSGGLDSRCIVAALCALGTRVYTINASIGGSQDQAFAREFARRMGTIHREEQVSVADPAFHQKISNLWGKSPPRELWPAQRPAFVWSGDGGSVGLGHVYMIPQVVALLRSEELDAAIDEYLCQGRHSVLHRLLRRNSNAALRGWFHKALREEFARIRCSDSGQDLHTFLVVNDQRRHLSGFYEDIDLFRFELQLPFFDGDFLASVIEVPLDLRLRHRFYNKLLCLFQPEVTQVPWQSYPGHEPCPLPTPQGLGYQWDASAFPAWRAHQKRELLRTSAEMLSAGDFPRPILDRRYLRLARLIYGLGLRDYAYVLKAALTYNRYWKACGGAYRLPATQQVGGCDAVRR